MTSDFGVTPQPPASLTVEPDRFSDEAWELLLSAQDSARRWRHGDLDVDGDYVRDVEVIDGFLPPMVLCFISIMPFSTND